MQTKSQSTVAVVVVGGFSFRFVFYFVFAFFAVHSQRFDLVFKCVRVRFVLRRDSCDAVCNFFVVSASLFPLAILLIFIRF